MKSKTLVQAVVLSAVLGLWGSTPGAFAILNNITNLYEFFDTNTLGVAPSGWSTGGGGFAVVTNDIFQSSPNSLLLANTNVGVAAYALKALSPTISSNYDELVRVSYRIQLSQVNASVNVLLTDAGTALFLRNTFNNGGQITTRSGASDIVIGSYTSNTWYDVFMLFAPNADKYDIEIRTNNTVMASATSLSFDGDRNFVYFYLQNYGKAGGQASAFVDNVFVFVPEPSVAVFVFGGIASIGLLRRRRSK